MRVLVRCAVKRFEKCVCLGRRESEGGRTKGRAVCGSGRSRTILCVVRVTVREYYFANIILYQTTDLT